jgi:hypothetical protein
MSLGRTVLCTLLVLGGVAAGAVLVPRAVHVLHAPDAPQRRTATATTPPAGGNAGRRGGSRPGHGAAAAGGQPRPTSADGSFVLLGTVAIDVAGALLVLAGLMLMLIARRTYRRGHRAYALYELHLSTHDQAKRQDLEDMIEAVANVVRVWPVERLRNGQPYLAFELICGVAPASGGPLEMEWSLNVRCEPASAPELDAADQRGLPRRQARTHPRRIAATAAGRPARARLPDAVSQGAQLRLLADRPRRRGGVLAA